MLSAATKLRRLALCAFIVVPCLMDFDGSKLVFSIYLDEDFEVTIGLGSTLNNKFGFN